GPHASSTHRVQLAADVHYPAQEGLPVLELPLPAVHRVEEVARQLARRPFDVPEVAAEPAKLAITAGDVAFDDSQRREPARVKAGGSSGSLALRSGRGGRIGQRPRALEVHVHRLAGY